ncbi:MAG TPA: hypothetical protein VGO06_12220, partial [Bosea sp. (in: a-proteobacteria)]|uniref:hypothetical protein n=1 Tax=Bosea sp. (in: a-proteobacteria) TaxID=1871050 RepID=UPI002E11C661|nr:hypothetical protein [Bosea sp. (in: a-proteobacteria)]
MKLGLAMAPRIMRAASVSRIQFLFDAAVKKQAGVPRWSQRGTPASKAAICRTDLLGRSLRVH